MAAIRLAVVDPHAVTRKGIRAALECSGIVETIVEASNADELLRVLSTTIHVPDIVVMDIKLAGMPAVDATKILKSRYPLTRVLICSALAHVDAVSAVFASGACGYVSKECEDGVLIRALQDVLSNKLVVETPGNALTIKSINYHNKTRAPLTTKDKLFLQLSATEMTYEQIAAKLNVSTVTVNGYRAKLFERLNVTSRTGLVLYAVRNGLVE